MSILIALFCAISLPALGQKRVLDYALVHHTSGLKDTVSFREVTRIYQAKYTRWPVTGTQVTIVLPSSKHILAAALSKLLYNGSFRDLQKFWLLLVFQGRFAPPVFLDTDAEIMNYIENNPGSVGIIDKSASSNLLKKAVRSVIAL